MGLNGKAVLPMSLGLGCDTMATMTTRILATPKERLIAITLLALGVPCSAQLATIMGILGGISVWALLLLFGVVLSQMVLVGFLAARVLPGDRSDFILELPPIRLPRFKNLATNTAVRVRWYLGEAVSLFLIGTALLFVLDRIGALGALGRVARPVVTGALGLPAESATVFVMGFLRRDYGAAGLLRMAHDGSLTAVQSVVALTVMTLFVPCVANLLMIIRERGLRTGLAILGAVTVIALVTGTVLNFAHATLHVTFSRASRDLAMTIHRSIPLGDLAPGTRGRVARIARDRTGRAERLAALGVTPGASIRLLQTFPGIVFECDQAEMAVERAVARSILVDVE